ncbi:MAG: ttgC 2 [Pseudomonas sp.]|nr:ttgC 2 [Pseudomonas sp.]
MSVKFFLPSLLVLALAACAVGPDYKAPVVVPPKVLSSTQGNYDRTHIESVWWAQFDDPILNQLVSQSMKGNRDLRVSYQRLQASRAIRDQVAYTQMPIITSGVDAQLGKAQVPGTTTKRVNIEQYDAGLDMSWEIDLFGHIQRQIESADADQDAAEADLFQLQISITAELVDAYGQFRGAQLRERIAKDNLKNQEDSRTVTVNLRDGGVGNELDVVRADARLAAVAAQVPQLQAEQVREKNRIATLLGERPESMSVNLSPAKLPAIAKNLPIGDPTQLLSHRPDVLAAERQLASATAQIGVNTADLFPRVSLTGFLGYTAARGSQIGSSAAAAWSLGPSITWPALDLRSVRARIRGANADAEGALANYEQHVLLALEESENAFSDYNKRQERLISLIKQSESSRKAADLAGIQYREGTADFLVLLDAERERLAAEDSQALGEIDTYRGIVAIYKALGGGWQPQPQPQS